MSRSARLLDLLQALRRHRRPVTAAVLAKETGVSLRTVYRDVATLIGQGAPIEGEAGLGYVLQPGYLLPPLMFTRDEVDALMLGLRFVAQRGDGVLSAAAADVLGKVAVVLPPDLEDATRTSAMLAGAAGPRGVPYLPVIRAAIAGETKLRLTYADKAGVTTDRLVWPVAVGFFDAVEMLAAWCEMRGDFRHFRLDRIAAAAVTDERLPKRHRVLLAAWRRRQGIEGLL